MIISLSINCIAFAAFCIWLTVRVVNRLPQKSDFGAQNTAWLYPCERFDLPVARHTASLGAKVTGWPYLVRLFHSLPFSGFCRNTCVPGLQSAANQCEKTASSGNSGNRMHIFLSGKTNLLASRFCTKTRPGRKNLGFAH